MAERSRFAIYFRDGRLARLRLAVDVVTGLGHVSVGMHGAVVGEGPLVSIVGPSVAATAGRQIHRMDEPSDISSCPPSTR